MGWSFNGVTFHHGGSLTTVHADGNNVAWKCPKCNQPVLLVYQNGRIGSGPNRPSICPCGTPYFLDPQYSSPEPPIPTPPNQTMTIV